MKIKKLRDKIKEIKIRIKKDTLVWEFSQIVNMCNV